MLSFGEKIFNKADDNITWKALVRCINMYDFKFHKLPSVKSKGNSKVASQSARKQLKEDLITIGLSADERWIVGWQSWSHPERTEFQWSKMQDEEIINQVFDGKILLTMSFNTNSIMTTHTKN